VAESPEQRIRQIWARWNEGDRTVREDELHPDVELHSQFSRVDGRPFVGYDGIHEWMATIDEQFSSWQLSIETVDEQPDERLLVLGWVDLVARTSGVGMRQPVAWLIEFEDDRIRRWQTWFSHDDARAATQAGG
jgi:ketosteroid isomerase-like protein